MNPLPSAVEHSLIEAGCSPTEILLIQHMLSGDPTTLRILAQRTGKSTGVLDQAMKKLMKKGIVVREMLNNSPKFVLKSLQNIVQWLHDETLHRREMLLRKYQTFEAFVATMENEQSRPEMQYFDGDDGLEQAYFSLLDQGKHWRQFIALNGREQDDPLWQMRVRLFRARKEAGVFCHVLTHDTEAGRAFQARDQYEYRETMLISKESCPIPCEKIIVGNVVACFQHAQKRACFVRFQEQAESEAGAFDLLWSISHRNLLDSKNKTLADSFSVNRKTTLLSNLRSFALRPMNLCLVTLSFFLAISFTAISYGNALHGNEIKLKEKIKSTVGIGSSLFDEDEIDFVREVAQIDSHQYKNLVLTLQKIRRDSDADISYAYLMRPTSTAFRYEFIADADGLHPTQPIDFNDDGVIDESDEYILPGRIFVASSEDVILRELPKEAVVNDKPVKDQWGNFYSAVAPIFNSEGAFIALLGVDVKAEELSNITQSTFIATHFFLGSLFFTLFIFGISNVVLPKLIQCFPRRKERT